MHSTETKLPIRTFMRELTKLCVVTADRWFYHRYPYLACPWHDMSPLTSKERDTIAAAASMARAISTGGRKLFTVTEHRIK